MIFANFFVLTLCLKVDVTVYHRGAHGDLNETGLVGSVDEMGRKLVRVAYECLHKASEIGKRLTTCQIVIGGLY